MESIGNTVASFRRKHLDNERNAEHFLSLLQKTWWTKFLESNLFVFEMKFYEDMLNIKTRI